jgi:hypothetical protein
MQHKPWLDLNLRQLYIFFIVILVYIFGEFIKVNLFLGRYDNSGLILANFIVFMYILFSRKIWLDRLPYFITATGLIFSLITRYHMDNNIRALMFGFGMAVAMFLGIMSILYIERHQERVKNWGMWFTIVGYLLSVWGIFTFLLPIII